MRRQRLAALALAIGFVSSAPGGLARPEAPQAGSGQTTSSAPSPVAAAETGIVESAGTAPASSGPCGSVAPTGSGAASEVVPPGASTQSDTVDIDLQNAPHWARPYQGTADGLVTAVEAIAGKPPGQDLCAFLKGVVEIQRSADVITLIREDGDRLELTGKDPFGDRILRGVEKAETKLATKLGEPVGAIVTSISAVKLTGSHIAVVRGGEPVVPIKIKRQKQAKKYWVKQVRLADLGFDAVRRDGHATIENISGFSAVLSTMDLAIELREFSREVNRKGEEVFVVGIKNPLPPPLSAIFGLHQVLHLRFTEHSRKKVTTEQIDSD